MKKVFEVTVAIVTFTLFTLAPCPEELRTVEAPRVFVAKKK